ncbi:MAG TPA: condensation domain-containing protein, partial [Thermoanaerobaculia bacterium]|nr:condensation domain-containing protein [Thermoanaerobaculia bacterium]
MADLSSRIAALSPKRRALLAQRLRSEGGAAAAPTIPRREVAGPVRLSYAQERLWFLDRWQPGSPAYNLLDVAQMQGFLAVPALAAALREVLCRHEVLRTVVLESEGEPFQVTSPLPPEPLPVIDLSTLPEPVRQRVSRDLALAQGNLPFDLARGPLLRACLLRLAAAEHWLLWVTHHMVADLWSFGVMLRELTLFYRAGRTGEPARLPELSIQYADFAVWQRGWLAGEVLERQLAYWRRQLAGAPVILDLPVDRPRPVVQSSAGAVLHFTLPLSVTSALKALGKAAGATPFMVLLATFNVLLHRYTGQESLLLGSPVAGRTRPELEPLVGLFVNTLVLRADFAPDLSFGSLLAQVRETTLGAFAHQDLPFERLVEDLQPARDPSRLPLVQALFTFQKPLGERIELPDLTLTPLVFETAAAKCDLSLFLTDSGGALAGAVEYNRDLFQEATIERLASHFTNLVLLTLGNEERLSWPLSELSLLGDRERRQILEWGSGPVLPPGEWATLAGLFAAQAARTPESEALIWGERRWTYGDLAVGANLLAGRLAALGIGPEERVAVCLPRSAGLLVALLGVLGAGGAYVPIDPTYPAERRAFMLADSAASVVLTSADLLPALPLGPQTVLCLDPETGEPETAGPQSAPRAAGPGNLAYLIYTSGSTGRPKAVAIEHRSAAGRLAWAREAFSDEELSGTLFATSVCFDLSIFELFAPLSCGGRVILAENAMALPGLPNAPEVRLVNTVPSALAELVREGHLPGGVRTVNLAGEPLPRSLAAAIHGTGTVRRL